MFDVIIVGSGSAGGALAGRLSEASSKQVLVLEGGPVYAAVDEMPAALLQPASMAAAAPGHPNNWADLVEARPGLKLPYPRGKGLGGSSSINGCVFFRGTRDDFTRWADAGNDEWSYEKVLPIFKRLESDMDFHGEHHGSDGPIPVMRAPAGRVPEFAAAFNEVCRDLGFADDPDKNAPSAGGVGPVPMNVRNGQRVGTALGYLLPAMGRPNVTMIGNAVVERVIIEGTQAVGVEALIDGESRTFHGSEIVIAAGALRTPQILMLSGVGPADHLRAHGIAVVQDLAGVGQNLTDHPSIGATWQGDVRLPHLPDRGLVTSCLHWCSEGSEMQITPFGVKTGDLMGARHVLRRPVKAVGALRGSSVRSITKQARLLRHPMLGISVARTESRGTVTLHSADPQDAPKISFDLLREGIDRERAREAVRLADEIFQSPAMRRLKCRIVGLDAADLADRASLDAWVQARISSGHPSCTCKMGSSADPTAVVDQHLRVHGVEGLRVADTSVFPMLTTRGPNATAIMVGDRLADWLA